jgi:hypothetical protein
MTDIDDITTRNRIRAESQLPLVDVAQELARIERARKQKAWEAWLVANRVEYERRFALLPLAIGFFGNRGKHAKVIADLRAIYESDK